jgi:hypothetical protein
MNQREIFPASIAIFSSCPISLNIGVVKMKRGSKMVAVTPSMIHDLCK